MYNNINSLIEKVDCLTDILQEIIDKIDAMDKRETAFEEKMERTNRVLSFDNNLEWTDF